MTKPYAVKLTFNVAITAEVVLPTGNDVNDVYVDLSQIQIMGKGHIPACFSLSGYTTESIDQETDDEVIILTPADTLDERRRKAADNSFDYDGPAHVVESKGWEYVSNDPRANAEWRRGIFIEGGGRSGWETFVVRFKKGSNEVSSVSLIGG